VLSQNFLRDPRVAAEITQRLHGSDLPVIELGAGSGAVTSELVRRGHDVTAVELDPRWARTLRQRFGTSIRVVQTDMLRFRFPDTPYNVVSNVPYRITTPVLRLLFRQDEWRVAVLVVQWDVARKRRATLLTASWWPWYELKLVRRVPASAFRPVPRVDGGVIQLGRRADPLLSQADLQAYQRFVEAVFTGRGAGLAGILQPYLPRAELRRWARRNRVDAAALPRDLTAQQWASLYQTATRAA
jgi:23S rRNA (adenine-N6)-dimethyltransferase